jgi:hypothetical protein
MSTYRIWDGYSLTYQDTPTDEFACMRMADFTDSKGVPVYEGDIVTDSRGKGVVEYSTFDRRFFLRAGLETRGFGNDPVVIGNAFEDPQLL